MSLEFFDHIVIVSIASMTIFSFYIMFCERYFSQ